ncbi:MAG: AIR synthase-related protein, partial [Betaproteobacteria bacterium]
QLSPEQYRLFMDNTTRLNTPGIKLGQLDAVHALTDVTGFGLLGHLLEICKGSRLAAQIDFARLPLLPQALEMAGAGTFTGASGRNWAGYSGSIRLGQGLGDAEQRLLTDPQTSGGLLVSCAPEAVDAVLQVFRDEGFDSAVLIGEMQPGEPRITVA